MQGLTALEDAMGWTREHRNAVTAQVNERVRQTINDDDEEDTDDDEVEAESPNTMLSLTMAPTT
jgi:hypothetical protein